MTVCSQNLNDRDLAKLKTMRERDPAEFDKKLAKIVMDSIGVAADGPTGPVQQEIDTRIRVLLQTSTPGPRPTGRRSPRRPRRRDR